MTTTTEYNIPRSACVYCGCYHNYSVAMCKDVHSQEYKKAYRDAVENGDKIMAELKIAIEKCVELNQEVVAMKKLLQDVLNSSVPRNDMGEKLDGRLISEYLVEQIEEVLNK